MSPDDPGPGRRHTNWRPEHERPRSAAPEPTHRTLTASPPAAAPEPAPPEQATPAPAQDGLTPLTVGVRYVLPAVVVLGGLIVMAFGSEVDLEGGAGIIGAGVSIFVINLLLRAGTSGEKERQREQDARDYLTKHGHWPE
jgi:hypothetical protein